MLWGTTTPCMSQEMTPADEEASESAEVEVVEGSKPAIGEEVEALSTFTESEGPFSYKVIPVIKDATTDWRVVVYMSGVQGPVYESDQRVTDEAADELGMSRKLQDRINEALDYANRELSIPAELGDQKRQKRSLHELEVLMDE